tara:strand:+ start:626 stop:895 length:270 start_codon:yes stop_codon:yes gene_type:complete
MNITPQNRQLLIEVIDEAKNDNKSSSLVLPEDYEKPKSEYAKVKVLDDSACSLPLGSHVVVPRHMIQEINIDGAKFHLVQENYVLASVE